MPPKGASKKGGVSFADNGAAAAAAPSESPAALLHRLVALPSDNARLTELKKAWDQEPHAALAAFVREFAQEFATRVGEYLRALLGLVGLIAGRDFHDLESQGAPKGTSFSVEVLPKIVQNVLLVLEAPERAVAGGSGAATATAAAMPSELKFFALHAFNQCLQYFPPLVRSFVPLMLDSAARELEILASRDAKSAALPASYAGKLVETLGMLVSSHTEALVPRAATVTAQMVQLLRASLEASEVEDREAAATKAKEAAAAKLEASAAAAAAAAGSKKKAAAAPSSSAAPGSLVSGPTPLHSLIEMLMNVLANMVTKLLVRLPRNFPSVRYVHPRAWPLGSEARADGEEEGEEEDEENEQKDGNNNADDGEDEQDDDDAQDTYIPRTYYTEPLSTAPVRAGVPALSLSGSDLSALVSSLLQFHERVGVAQEGSSIDDEPAGFVRDRGVTVLAFMPLLVALDNQRVALISDKEAQEQALAEHGENVYALADFIVTQLQGLPLDPSAPITGSMRGYLSALGGVIKYADRRACLDFVSLLYTKLVDWLDQVVQGFKALHARRALAKMVTSASATFLALFYCMDTHFEELVGLDAYLEGLNTLLANPLLGSHLSWMLRKAPEAPQRTRLLRQYMRALLDPSKLKKYKAKTVRMILNALGSTVGYSRAFEETASAEEEQAGENDASAAAAPAAPASSGALVPAMSPFLSDGPLSAKTGSPLWLSMIDVLTQSLANAPLDVGQPIVLALARIVMAAYDEEAVRERLADVLAAFVRVLNEQVVVAYLDAHPDALEDDPSADVEPVFQMQYCVLDMLHMWFQPQPTDPEMASKSTALREAHGYMADAQPMPYPFDQQAFVRILAEDEHSVRKLRRIAARLLAHTRRAAPFPDSDDAALRNSEVHLLREMLAHKPLFERLVVSPPEHDEEEAEEESGDMLMVEPEDQQQAGDEPAGSAMDDAAIVAAHSSQPPMVPLPELTPAALVTQLLEAIRRARDNGSHWRVEDIRECLRSVSAPLSASPASVAAVRASLTSPEHAALRAATQKDADTWQIVQAWAQ